MLSALFYTTLLSTTFVLPLVLSARNDAGAATAVGTTQVWERSTDACPPDEGLLDTRTKVQMHRDLRWPQSVPDDVPASGSAARQAPMDISGPDTVMIKPGKVRAKTIKG
jgi:hypothetical protein